VRRISPCWAGRPQGVYEGGAHQDGASQALAEAGMACQSGLRAYVALCRFDPLRARLWREADGLLIATSCYEVSQPGGCIHRAKRSGWRRRVCTQHIRPRWHAGHTAAGWSSAGAAVGSGGTGGVGLTGCWSSTRHRSSFAWRPRFASNP